MFFISYQYTLIHCSVYSAGCYKVFPHGVGHISRVSLVSPPTYPLPARPTPKEMKERKKQKRLTKKAKNKEKKAPLGAAEAAAAPFRSPLPLPTPSPPPPIKPELVPANPESAPATIDSASVGAVTPGEDSTVSYHGALCLHTYADIAR